MSRGKVWLALGAIALVAMVAGALWLGGWFDSSDARARAEQILSEAIGRPVHIETLEVDALDGFVRLQGLRVDNLPQWGPGPLMTAETVTLSVELDELLDRHVDGELEATGVVLGIVKRGAQTNLDGMGRPSEQHEPVELDLDIVIDDGDVDVVDIDRDETLHLQRVRLESRLSNRDEARRSAVRVDVERVSLHGVDVHDLQLRVLADEEAVRLQQVHGRVGESGSIDGSGGLELAASTWSFALQLTDIALEEPIVPLVAAVYPPIIAASQSGVELPRGRMSGGLRLHGQGLHWISVRPTLSGRGDLRIEELHVPATSLVATVAHLAGAQPGPLTLEEAGVEFSVAQEWIHLDTVTLGRAEVRSPVRGRVGLDGQLDLLVDLMPVLELFGDDAYAAVARYTTSIPIRVRGTTAEPAIEPPTTKDVAKGLLGGALKRAAGQ